MERHLVICESCSEQFPIEEAYEVVEGEEGHNTYWCSKQCLDQTMKEKGLD